jgi:hypothetical protein
MSPPRVAGTIIGAGALVMAALWALAAWLVGREGSGAWAVVQAVVAVAGVAAMLRLAWWGVRIWQGRAGPDVLGRAILAPFVLAALWWLAVSLARV